jgi:hypothetical protein
VNKPARKTTSPRKNQEWEGSVRKKEQRKIRARSQKSHSIWFGFGMFGVIGWSIVVPPARNFLGNLDRSDLAQPVFVDADAHAGRADHRLHQCLELDHQESGVDQSIAKKEERMMTENPALPSPRKTWHAPFSRRQARILSVLYFGGLWFTIRK